MKVALINPWYITQDSIGGTERFTEDLAIALHELGNTVDIYMLSGESYSKNGINYISLNMFGDGVIADEYIISKKFGVFDNYETYNNFAKRIEVLIKVDDYDLLQLNSNLFLCAWSNKKRVFTIHSNYSEFKILGNNEEFNFMLKIMVEQAKNNQTYYVCPSSYYFKEWEKVLKDKALYIPHAINMKRLICDVKKEILVDKYNLDENKIKILLPSRLEMMQKRPYLILEALNLLDKSIKDKYQVVFTGIDTQYENNAKELKKLAKEYDIDAKFIIFDAIKEGYKLADIVCIPSSSESFGYSALESLYLGKVTILSDIPTYNEFAKETNAIIFGNTASELAMILKNIDNINLNKNNQELFENKYSMKSFANNYMGVFYGK